MPQPPGYDRAYSFTSYQAVNPSLPLPADQVELEYNRIKAALDALLVNIALIQRDDGDLANDSVGRDQLSPDIEVGFNVPRAWFTSTAYTTSDTVFNSTSFYRCLVPHTSGVFATDLAAAKWELIANFSVLTQNAGLIVYDNGASGLSALNAQAAIDELAVEKLNLAGGTMSGAIAMGTNRITGLGDPSAAQDAATKAYLIANYQPLDSDLTSIAAVVTTSFGRSLLAEASAATAFTTLKQAASESATGVLEIATEAENAARSSAILAVTPKYNPFPPGHLFGLTLSNNSGDATNDIDIAAGSARDSTDDVNLILAAALTKRLDAAWAVGSGNGGLDTGAIANTTYHIWLIKRSDTGVVDALFSTSASAPTMPTSYNYKRRIGSIIRESAAIVGFSQAGDEFLRKVPVNDVSTTDPGTSAVTAMLSVPLGVKVEALFSLGFTTASGVIVQVLVTSLDQNDTAPSNTVFDLAEQGEVSSHNGGDSSRFRITTNTSRQIRYRFSASNAATVVNVTTHGWIDTRGRLA